MNHGKINAQVYSGLGVNKKISLESTLFIVSTIFEIPIEDIKSRSRKRYLVDARHCFCHLAIHNKKNTLSEVGRFIGRDHSTALHSNRQAIDLFNFNPAFRDKVNSCLALMSNHNLEKPDISQLNESNIGYYYNKKYELRIWGEKNCDIAKGTMEL